MQYPVALLSDRKLGVPCVCLPQHTGYYHLLLGQLHPECRHLLAWREDQSLEMGSVLPSRPQSTEIRLSLTHSPLSTQTKGKLSPSQTALPGAFVIELRWGLWKVEEEKPGARWHSPGELQVSPLFCQIISHLTQRPNLLSKL